MPLPVRADPAIAVLFPCRPSCRCADTAEPELLLPLDKVGKAHLVRTRAACRPLDRLIGEPRLSLDCLALIQRTSKNFWVQLPVSASAGLRSSSSFRFRALRTSSRYVQDVPRLAAPLRPRRTGRRLRRMGEESRIIRLKRAIKAQQIKPRAATRATQVDPWGNRSRDSERA